MKSNLDELINTRKYSMLLIWMDETLHWYASIPSCSLPHGHVIMWRNWLFSFSWFPPTVTTIYNKVGRLSCPHLFIWRHEKWKITVCGPYAVTLLNRPPKFERYITKVVVEDGHPKDICYNGVGSRHNNHIGFNCRHNWESPCDHQKRKHNRFGPS